MKKFFVDESGFAINKKPKAVRVVTTPIARKPIHIDYFNDNELFSFGAKGCTMFFDIESYVNYFLIGFRCLENGKYVIFEDSPDSQINLEKLMWMVFNFRLIGFFSNGFDIPMMFLALRGYNAEMLKYYTNRLIVDDDTKLDWRKEFNIKIPDALNHIDLIEVCPLKGSLKKYSARLHAKRLQDLPFDPNKVLTYEEAEFTKNYCLGSDLVNTEIIFKELSEQMSLRYKLTDKYKIDLRSRSDAQIAEAVIKSEVYNKTKRKVKREEVPAGTIFKYKPPEFLHFQTPYMKERFQRVLDMQFEITDDGKLSMPETLKNMDMQIADTYYKLGKGGLHSKEKIASYQAIDGMILLDIDVESFYPRLILNSGLYPDAIGPIFLEIFEEIVNRRLHAKSENKNLKKQLKEISDKFSEQYKNLEIQIESYGAEADGLKITINGTFGKLGSRWSVMYAPNLLIQVTLTGQLALLMLIERMVLSGLRVVSANTDGIVLYIHESQYELLNQVKDQWCKEASLKMEETRYSALYSRDVNNYIAIKVPDEKGKVKAKLKGQYSNPWNDKELAIFRFHKNPMTTIVIEAVEQFLILQKPIQQTITECGDITKFICVRDVKGGAHKDGIYLGKVVRWYYSNDAKGEINYVLSGNKVPESESASPLMDLPDSLPDDINYQTYIEKANAILFDIGFYKKSKLEELF